MQATLGHPAPSPSLTPCARLLALALTALLACDSTGPESRDDLPALAFDAESGDLERGSDIYVRDAGDAVARPVLERVGSDRSPAWSPDGRRIAFSGTDRNHPAATPQILLVNADGSGLRALTDMSYRSYGPAWSPDGARIAFARWIDPFTWGLAIMNADGSNVVQIPNTGNAALFPPPSWSPDGTRLAYSGSFGDTYTIWVVRTDGSELTRLTSGNCAAATPAWSPDGSRIAYNCGAPAGGGLHLMNADGTGIRQVTFGLSDSNPTWSPDGDRIVFTRWRNATELDRSTDLYMIDVGSGEIRSLGETPLDERKAAWRPTP